MGNLEGYLGKDEGDLWMDLGWGALWFVALETGIVRRVHWGEVSVPC